MRPKRGRITPADRVGFRRWLGQFDGEVEVVLEGCTGWRFVAEECAAAGVKVHVADPAEVAARRSSKRRAKTDRIDAHQLRQLLEKGEVPESWIPPRVVLEVRERVRLYLDLLEDKQAWQHRIHATLFQHGVPKVEGKLLTGGRAERGRDDPDLSEAGRDAVDTALRVIAALDADLTRIRAELTASAGDTPAPESSPTSTVWARCWPPRSGRNSATPAGSPPPGTRSATPGWTSPSTTPTANTRAARR